MYFSSAIVYLFQSKNQMVVITETMVESNKTITLVKWLLVDYTRLLLPFLQPKDTL